MLLGCLTGTIISNLLAPVEALSFLTESAQITWEPKADLNVIQFDLFFRLKLNLAMLIGMALAFWIYRKL